MWIGKHSGGFAPSPLFETETGTGSSPGQATVAEPVPSAIPQSTEQPREAGTEAPQPTEALSPSPEPSPTPAPKKDWKEARLAKQTAKLHELQAEIDRLKAGGPAATAAPVVQPSLEAAVSAEVEKREFLKACQDVATEGRKSFTDFDARIGQIAQLINPADAGEVTQYNSMLAAAIDTGKGHEVLHVLGGDPDEAARIMALPLAKMAVELTKIALKAPEATSTAVPRPIPQVGGRGTPAELIDPTDATRSDKLSTAEWMKRRNEQTTGRGRYERTKH